jgi:LytS/YehU family sensor histidine kinase
VFLGALGYVALVTVLRYFSRGPMELQAHWPVMVARFTRSSVFGALGAWILFVAAREREARRRLHEAEQARLETDRQLSEVRLQLLQSQIEPHFLFNSLASVKRLYETDRSEGGRLLRHLRTYLEAAVRNQGAEARLGDEVDLARSFLRIFEVRMAGRLEVRVEVPPELRPAILPTFMLGTLVENAIKHGVAPKGCGGTLTLSARRCGDVLAIEVADDGVGFREHCGPGVGLSNTRARLRTLFGHDAGIDIVANPTGGVTATLRVPHRVEPSKVAA